MTTTDHLADALTALKTVPNCTALLRGLIRDEEVRTQEPLGVDATELA